MNPDTGITVKHKAIKLLEGNIGENLDESAFCKDFSNTKAQSMKKFIRWTLLKLKSLLCKRHCQQK